MLLLLTLAVSESSNASTCKVLSLSDGSDLQAYEAAVFKGLADNLPADQVDYDVITGISFSAVSAAYIAIHPKG